MRTIVAFFLAFAATVHAEDFNRTLRHLQRKDRARRRAALADLADARVRPANSSQQRAMERALKRFLSDRFPGKDRALAVRALGTLGTDRVYEMLLDRLEDETDDRVLKAAEGAFRRAPEKTSELLAGRLHRAREPIHKAVVLRMLGAVPGRDARERIRRRAAMGDHWCPRAAATHALARDRDTAVLPTLVEILDRDDPGLITAAIESLTRLTGLRHGRDIPAWKAWWVTRDALAALPEPPEDPKDPGNGEERRVYAHEVADRGPRPYFFGIPIRGRQVVFVFDVSASMRYKLPLAYDQLSRAVKSLESNSQFEVIFFNENVWPWRGRLSWADPVTKELLVRHLPSIEIRSYTNLFDAVERGLRLRPQELFVISDGAPNRGRWRLPRDILREVAELNNHRTKIHTVSVVRAVDGDEHVSLLKQIAEAAGGTHVERTLK